MPWSCSVIFLRREKPAQVGVGVGRFWHLWEREREREREHMYKKDLIINLAWDIIGHYESSRTSNFCPPYLHEKAYFAFGAYGGLKY